MQESALVKCAAYFLWSYMKPAIVRLAILWVNRIFCVSYIRMMLISRKLREKVNAWGVHNPDPPAENGENWCDLARPNPKQCRRRPLMTYESANNCPGNLRTLGDLRASWKFCAVRRRRLVDAHFARELRSLRCHFKRRSSWTIPAHARPHARPEPWCAGRWLNPRRMVELARRPEFALASLHVEAAVRGARALWM